MKPQRLSKAKRSSLDLISNLPENIIESILCLVPIKEAVRTSILSSKWRYKWGKIPKLEFSEDQFSLEEEEGEFDELGSNMNHITNLRKLFNAIYQVLLLHQGPIVEFTLSMDSEDTFVEVDQIILHLSRCNTLKKFTLNLPDSNTDGYQVYRVPLSIFSLHQLTDLCLGSCILDFKPTFSGFDYLTSLSLTWVITSTKTLVHLLSNCPNLKSLCLMTYESITEDDAVTFNELLNCLPLIEHICTTDEVIKCFAQSEVPREPPTKLLHLKYLCIHMMRYVDNGDLQILGLVIRSAPNLENLKLQAPFSEDDPDINTVILEEYSDIWLEHLIELEMDYFCVSNCALEFMKLIFAKSPMLEMVSIVFGSRISDYEVSKILNVLLNCCCASPMVEISVLPNNLHIRRSTV